MPVTQTRKEPRAEPVRKPMKQPLRLNPEKELDVKLKKDNFHPLGGKGKRVARPRYRYSDAYQEHFVASRATSGAVPQLSNTYLRPNAKFVGEQQSGASRYDIKVELKTVDLVSSVVTGFFQILGLTEEHPLITTCFKGEIINNPLNKLEWGNSSTCGRAVHTRRYLFITEEANWASFPKNDMEHWKKLTGLPGHVSEETLVRRLRAIQRGTEDDHYVYMRWKEEFLLPDLRVKLLKGASFEGFYYVVLNIGGSTRASDGFSAEIIPGTILGLYFHTQSEKFQSLSLRYVEERGSAHTFDFA